MESSNYKIFNPWVIFSLAALFLMSIQDVNSGQVNAKIYARDLALASSTLSMTERYMLRLGLKRSHNIRYTRASWYGGYFHGRSTANMEVFDKNLLTAAHKTLPLGSYLLVTNLNNDKQVLVRVNDRGPYVRGREIDLSEAAAKIIGSHGGGVVPIRYEILVEA